MQSSLSLLGIGGAYNTGGERELILIRHPSLRKDGDGITLSLFRPERIKQAHGLGLASLSRQDNPTHKWILWITSLGVSECETVDRRPKYQISINSP